MIIRHIVILSALALGFAPAARAALSDGLEVCLDFDDNIDNSVSGPYDTRLTGIRCAARFAPGKFGGAADFRAVPNDKTVTSDWAVVLPSAFSAVYEKDWSVSLWVNTSQKEDCVIIGNKDWDSGANPGWAVSTIHAGARLEKQGMLNWAVKGGPRRDARFDSEKSFVSGKWRHLVATFDRTNNRVSLYLDGELLNATSNKDFGSALDAKAVLGAGFTTAIGGSRDGTWGATALVDDVGIWSRVLEPHEIQALGRRAIRNVPEPEDFGLLGAGVFAAVVLVRRRKRAA